MLNPFKKSNIKIAKPKSFSKELNEKPNIVACFESVVGIDKKTKKSGRATLAICPFHDESNPSFAMYEDTNSAHCFSCGWSGDSFIFLMKMLNFNFMEAKEYAVNNKLFRRRVK